MYNPASMANDGLRENRGTIPYGSGHCRHRGWNSGCGVVHFNRARVIQRPTSVRQLPTRTASPRTPRGIVGSMTSEDIRRHVAIDRVGANKYTAMNERGGTISVGDGSGDDFTPVELLLTAIAGCTAIDVDLITSRRAEPDSFRVEADANKVRDESGNHLTDIVVTFKIVFPPGAGGDNARAILPDIVKKSHERLCTVSRTIELGTPITPRIE
jgi:putative redox protein